MLSPVYRGAVREKKRPGAHAPWEHMPEVVTKLGEDREEDGHGELARLSGVPLPDAAEAPARGGG